MQRKKHTAKMNFDPSLFIAPTDAMITEDEAFYLYDLSIKTHQSGALVNIGIYRGGSTFCMANAAKIWGGKVVAIDPHQEFEGLFGGNFSEEDHYSFVKNMKEFDMEKYIDYRRATSKSVSSNWSTEIDFIFIDGDHRKEAVLKDIEDWKQFIRIGGVIAFHDADNGGEVDQAIDETLYLDSSFVPIQGIGKIRALKKHAGNLEIILCGGLQNSGAKLVSECFLQHPNIGGTLDMWSEGLLSMPFSDKEYSWCRMAISSFRWQEVADFYLDQGWNIKPLLVIRDVRSAYALLRTKPYGLNGITASDPPLRMRFRRFLSDWKEFRKNNWPIVQFESLISNPEETLLKCCVQLNLSWHKDMIGWQNDLLDDVEDVFNNEISDWRLKDNNFKSWKEQIINTAKIPLIPAEDLVWLEKTFYEFNKENDYPIHVEPERLDPLPDRPNYYVTQHSKNIEEMNRMRNEIDRLQNGLNRLQKELDYYKLRLNRIIHSKFWKITAPLRKIYNSIYAEK